MVDEQVFFTSYAIGPREREKKLLLYDDSILLKEFQPGDPAHSEDPIYSGIEVYPKGRVRLMFRMKEKDLVVSEVTTDGYCFISYPIGLGKKERKEKIDRLLDLHDLVLLREFQPGDPVHSEDPTQGLVYKEGFVRMMMRTERDVRYGKKVD